MESYLNVLLPVAGLVVGFIAGWFLKPAQPKKSQGEAKSVKNRQRSASNVPETNGPVELYVGNLAYETTENDLKDAFARFGEVLSVRVIGSRPNGRSKGYGFVEIMGTKAANAASAAMNGKDFMGRKLVVNIARSKGKDA